MKTNQSSIAGAGNQDSGDFDVFEAIANANEESEDSGIIEDLNDQLFGDGNSTQKMIEDQEEEDEESDDDQEEEEEYSDDENQEDEEEETEEEGNDMVHPSYSELLRAELPDREFNSLEEYEAAVAELIQTQKESISNHDAIKSGILTIAGEYPEFAAFVSSLKKGESWRTAVIKSGILPEDLQVEDQDEEDAESVVLSKQKEKERRSKAAQSIREFESNQRESQNVISKYQKNHNLKDDEMTKIIGVAQTILDPMAKGKWTDEIIDALRRVSNFDNAIKTAKAQGEIEGRNQKIKVEKKRKKGDFQPRATSGAVIGSRPKRQADPILDDLEQTIFSKPTSLTDMINK